jgi:hypothetical protein
MMRALVFAFACLALSGTARRPHTSSEEAIAQLLLTSSPSAAVARAPAQRRASSPTAKIKLLSTLEKSRVLTFVAGTGILRYIESNGLLSKLESKRFLSENAELIVKAEELGLISLADQLINTKGKLISLAGWLLLFYPFYSFVAGEFAASPVGIAVDVVTVPGAIVFLVLGAALDAVQGGSAKYSASVQKGKQLKSPFLSYKVK